jgi:electron transfer flavoprotein beta subunit
VTVLTLGPPEAEEQVRDSLAAGADRGILLATDGEEWDPQATAGAILATIEAEQAAGGDFDLIILGNESADSGNFQVGIRVAQALDRPVVTGLKGLSVEDGRARCEQEVTGGRDIYLVPLPAVVTVLEGINLPRYPSVPAKLRARQKPVEKSTPERPEPRLEMVRLVVPPGQGKQAEILGRGPEAAPAVVEMMRELGVA